MSSLKRLESKHAVELILAGKSPGAFCVDGPLSLAGKTGLKKLPSGLSCFELDASETDLVQLPDDLSVESTLVLRNCKKLRSLPEGLQVGTLDLQGCTSLVELPEGLDVWFLNLRGCEQLTALPRSAKIRNGALGLSGCKRLQELPSYLKRLSTLDVSDCPMINRLPKSLEIGLWIDIGGSGITELKPPNEEVGLRWRGVTINSRIAFAPETLTADEAIKEKNAELRRVIIERIGTERFMTEAKAKVIDRDTDPGGVRELLYLPLQNDEDMVYLSCICPSTSRHYLLRVPPTIKTCHSAAAWMAGFTDSRKYKPIIET